MAAAGIAGFATPVLRYELADMPVGKMFAAAVLIGLGDALKGITRGLPILGTIAGPSTQLLIGTAVVWGLGTKTAKNLFGPELAQLGQIVIGADTLNDQFRIQENTANFVGGLFGGIIRSKSPPVFQQTQRQALTESAQSFRSADLYAGAF